MGGGLKQGSRAEERGGRREEGGGMDHRFIAGELRGIRLGAPTDGKSGVDAETLQTAGLTGIKRDE